MVLKIKHNLYEKNMIVFTAYMVYISYMIYISNTLAFSNQKKNPNINVYNILQGYSRMLKELFACVEFSQKYHEILRLIPLAYFFSQKKILLLKGKCWWNNDSYTPLLLRNTLGWISIEYV